MKTQPRFRQRDVTRAVRATVAAGVDVERIEIENGKITVVASKTGAPDGDDKLDQELAAFEAGRG